MVSFSNFISSYFDTDSTSCFPTSVNENFTEVSDIFIYPNPAICSEKITIQINNEFLTKIKLLTLTGKEVFIKKVNQPNEVLFDISSIQSGIYLLQIITDKTTENKKLIIQNK